MPLVEKTIKIDAPIELVYKVSQDYSVRYDWDPFPEKISLVFGSRAELQIGTQVLVRSKLGMEMIVEFVQVSPPTRAAIKMVSGPWFMEKFAGSWIFESQGTNVTVVRFRYAISTRPAWLAFVGDRVATDYFSHTAAKRLVGLKNYCENVVVDNRAAAHESV